MPGDKSLINFAKQIIQYGVYCSSVTCPSRGHRCWVSVVRCWRRVTIMTLIDFGSGLKTANQNLYSPNLFNFCPDSCHDTTARHVDRSAFNTKLRSHVWPHRDLRSRFARTPSTTVRETRDGSVRRKTNTSRSYSLRISSFIESSPEPLQVEAGNRTLLTGRMTPLMSKEFQHRVSRHAGKPTSERAFCSIRIQWSSVRHRLRNTCCVISLASATEKPRRFSNAQQKRLVDTHKLLPRQLICRPLHTGNQSKIGFPARAQKLLQHQQPERRSHRHIPAHDRHLTECSEESCKTCHRTTVPGNAMSIDQTSNSLRFRSGFSVGHLDGPDPCSAGVSRPARSCHKLFAQQRSSATQTVSGVRRMRIVSEFSRNLSY